MIEIAESPDTNQWSEFVLNHPHGNIFQTPEMAEVYRRTKNYEPITLAAIDTTNDEMLAVLQAVVIKELSGFLGSFSARAIIQGGPLFVDTENGIKALKQLMEHYDKIVQKKALYTQIRTMWDTSNISSFLNSRGYEHEERLNFLIDLTKGVGGFWSQLYKSKRQAINKAKRIGVSVEKVEDKKLIPIFYDLVKESYKSSNVPVADVSLFESAFELLVPKNMCKFFLAKYKDSYVASTCFLCYNGLIFDWYGGVDRMFSACRANEFLEWHSLKWSAENGYRIFDFGGAGKPDEPYGPRQFKKEFGGKMVDYGRYLRIHLPIKMKIAEKGFNILQKTLFK